MLSESVYDFVIEDVTFVYTVKLCFEVLISVIVIVISEVNWRTLELL